VEEQTNKVALLEKMNCGYAAFQTLLAVLGEAQMTTAEVNDSWSIKDILTHLTAWQRAMVDRLHAAARNEKPALTTDLTDEEIDRLNEQFYQEGKARPLAEALTDFRTTYLQIVEVVQALPWEDLADAHRFVWLNGIPLWRYVAGDTYEHYQEHIESIQEFLKTGQHRN
jgi:hypothetical protein